MTTPEQEAEKVLNVFISESSDPRRHTNRLTDLIEAEIVTTAGALDMCLKYMSEDEVADMIDENKLSARFLGA